MSADALEASTLDPVIQTQDELDPVVQAQNELDPVVPKHKTSRILWSKHKTSWSPWSRHKMGWNPWSKYKTRRPAAQANFSFRLRRGGGPYIYSALDTVAFKG